MLGNNINPIKPRAGASLNYAHPQARGLVGYWPFNEGCGARINDASINDNHGLIENVAFTGTTSNWSGSNFGGTLRFDGANDVVNIPAPNGGSLDIVGKNISFGGWVNPTVSNVYQLILGKLFADANNRQYALYLSGLGTTTIFWALNGVAVSAGQNSTISTAYVLNKWNHVFLTYNGITVTIYLNGRSVFTSAQTASILNKSTAVNFYIGSEPGFYHVNGFVDEPRVYNRCLTYDEVKMLYANPHADWLTPVWAKNYAIPVTAGGSDASGRFFHIFN